MKQKKEGKPTFARVVFTATAPWLRCRVFRRHTVQEAKAPPRRAAEFQRGLFSSAFVWAAPQRCGGPSF